jgi:hypothetical protein
MMTKYSSFGASLLLAVAAACTVTTNNSSDTCAPDVTVTTCASGTSGYSCTGSDTPDQANTALTCSMGVQGNAGSTIYCCTTGVIGDDGGGTTCAPDTTVTTCASGTTGYSCTGSDTPDESDATLSCGPAAAGNAGSSIYCCSIVDGGVAGTCAADVTSQECAAVAGSTAYSCSGTAAPGATDSSLTCGPGATADGGAATVYCCTSSAADSGAEAEAGTCTVGADTGTAACDQCLDANCCPALTACGTEDEAGVDDAGVTACGQLVQCILDCVAGNAEAGIDGGTLSSCESDCGGSYSTTDQLNADSLVLCQATSCSAQCQ